VTLRLGSKDAFFCGGLLLASLLESNLASAAEALVAELEYEASGAQDTCPEPATFRASVTERLGRDPFVAHAPRKIFVKLERVGSTFTALVRVVEGGTALGERRIEAQADCAELVAGAALAVSIAIDPLVALGPPREAEPAPPPRAVAIAAPPPIDATAGAENPRGNWFVLAGLEARLGAVPGPAVGVRLGAGYGSRVWSLALHGFGVLPRSAELAGTRREVSASLWGAELAPCWALRGTRGCVLLASGVLLARGGGVDVPLSDASWHVASGASFGRSFAMGALSLTPTIAAGLRLRTTLLSLEGQPVWTTPRLMASLGLELGYRL
jgi:hypothetical protein